MAERRRSAHAIDDQNNGGRSQQENHVTRYLVIYLDQWCSSVPVIPNNAAFPNSSVDVTSACTGVLHATSGRDDRIRAIFRNRPYAVPHTRVTCVVIDIVQSRYTPRSRMLAVVLTSLPHNVDLKRWLCRTIRCGKQYGFSLRLV